MDQVQYRIEELIGEGGYGQVFRARLHDGRAVAVKRIFPDGAEHHRASLLREARLATALGHANIVSIIGSNQERTGHVALVMELVDGIDLACLLRVTRVPLASAIYIARALLAAVAHAHEVARLVHRDLSPHNVLVSFTGEVKLTDFGLARPSGLGPTQPGRAPGKPRYMSPEQFQGKPVDSRSDLFSLGMVLYQLIAGSVPYDELSEHVVAVMNGHAELVPLAERCPEVPPEISAVVARLLAHDAAERYPSARDVLAALPEWPHGQRELIALLGQLRKSGAFPRREPRTTRRKSYGRKLAAAIALMAVLGIGAIVLHAHLIANEADAGLQDGFAPDSLPRSWEISESQ